MQVLSVVGSSVELRSRDMRVCKLRVIRCDSCHDIDVWQRRSARNRHLGGFREVIPVAAGSTSCEASLSIGCEGAKSFDGQPARITKQSGLILSLWLSNDHAEIVGADMVSRPTRAIVIEELAMSE